MLILWTLKVVLPLVMSAWPPRVLQGPTVCPANGPDALRLGAWKPDSAAVDAAQRLLARWSVDFIIIDSTRMADPTRMALDDTIASTLRRHLGDDTDRILLHVMLASSDATGSPAKAAAHFYIRLGLPRASMEKLLASPDVAPRVRAAAFEELSFAVEEMRGVGLGRRWIVCHLARRMLAKRGLRSGERQLFEHAVTILQNQARLGNTQAAELLEEANVRAARDRL